MTSRQWKELMVDPVRRPASPIEGYVVEAYDLDRLLQQIDDAAPLPRQTVVMLTAPEIQPGAPWRGCRRFRAVVAEGARQVRGQHPRGDIQECARYLAPHPEPTPRRRDRHDPCGELRGPVSDHY